MSEMKPLLVRAEQTCPNLVKVERLLQNEIHGKYTHWNGDRLK